MTSRYILKTVAPDGTSHGGFKWPLEVGAGVTAPDWTPEPVCGGGLHGLLNGAGDGVLLDWSPDAVWLVAEIPDDATVVELNGKVKVETCTVVHVGDRQTAPQFLMDLGHQGVVAGTATAGDEGTATAGDGGTATAGYRGTATAGDEGTATAGYRGTATAGYRGTATAGDGGTATAGYGGTATAGDGGTATAGDEGVLIISWWDAKAIKTRRTVGLVGEDGIEPNVTYRCTDAGQLVKADS